LGSVFTSQTCHYCGGKAESEDHIVPRAILPKPQSRLPYWFRELNVVPCCKACNNRKGANRSDCECGQCRGAWGAATARFIEPEYRTMPRATVKVLRSPAE